MKRIIQSITGIRSADSVSINFALLPGSGNLDMSIRQSEHGPVTSYQLAARLMADSWPDYPESLEGEYELMVTLDDGTVRHMGTDDTPARVEVSVTGTIGISCSWEYPTGWPR